MLRKEELSQDEVQQLYTGIESHLHDRISEDHYTGDSTWRLRNYARIRNWQAAAPNSNAMSSIAGRGHDPVAPAGGADRHKQPIAVGYTIPAIVSS